MLLILFLCVWQRIQPAFNQQWKKEREEEEKKKEKEKKKKEINNNLANPDLR